MDLKALKEKNPEIINKLHSEFDKFIKTYYRLEEDELFICKPEDLPERVLFLVYCTDKDGQMWYLEEKSDSVLPTMGTLYELIGHIEVLEKPLCYFILKKYVHYIIERFFKTTDIKKINYWQLIFDKQRLVVAVELPEKLKFDTGDIPNKSEYTKTDSLGDAWLECMLNMIEISDNEEDLKDLKSVGISFAKILNEDILEELKKMKEEEDNKAKLEDQNKENQEDQKTIEDKNEELSVN
jgi:hypothetical protein